MTAINVSKIVADESVSQRQKISRQTVEEYAERMKDGDEFPPVVVFHDGREYHLADGFHRLEASKSLGRLRVEAEVRKGSKRDAVLYACQANARHGLHRSPADKRKAVRTLLEDPEWSGWSDREIASKASVSKSMVRLWAMEWGISRPGGVQYRRGDEVRIMHLPREKRPCGIAGKLQRLLVRKGVSVEELARRAGVTKPAVYNFLRGDNDGLHLSTAVRYAAALGVTLNAFWDDDIAAEVKSRMEEPAAA